MIPAAVGFQCPRCVQAFAKRTRQNEGPFGGAVSARPELTTYVLIGVNLAVFLLILLTGGDSSVWVNRLGLSPVASYHFTALNYTLEPGVAAGAYWQVVTSIFTHANFMHIGMNMLTLWFLGPPLERLLGRARFLALYFLAGLTGSALVLWLTGPTSVTLGASGSLFGLIAALIVILHRLHQDFRQILLWLGINVVMTLVMIQSISWQGHLGGLVGGAAITAILVFMPRRNRARHQWLALAGYTLLVAAAIVARILLLRG
jgi:membrane associated rhomboid family serine protease